MADLDLERFFESSPFGKARLAAYCPCTGINCRAFQAGLVTVVKQVIG